MREITILVNDEPNFVEQDKLKSWVRLIILFAMGVIGTVGMWSVVVVLPALQNEFNLDRGNASLLYATTMVGFGLGNFLIGKVTDRLGVKIPIIVATILLITSYLLAIISNQFWQLLILQVFMGLSSATFFGPFMADIGNYFNRRRGLAVSIVGSANYIAGAIWPLLISYFLSFGNWKDVYLGIVIICFIVMLPLILILKDNRIKHNNADINIGVSNLVLQQLRNYKTYNPQNEFILYNGVDTSKFFKKETAKNDIFTIDNTKDGNPPNICTFKVNKEIKFFLDCSIMHSSDFFDKMLKLKKKETISEFTIKDNCLVFFLLPDNTDKLCESNFTTKQIKDFSKKNNNFVEDRIKRKKALKFEVPNGNYIVNTYRFYDVFGDTEISGFEILGHLIELKK